MTKENNMSDFIPRSDADFSDWLQNFITYASANSAALGLTAADITPVQTATTDFDTARAANDAMQAQARGTRATKDGKRGTTEDLTRTLVARIQTNPSVTDAQRSSLAITVRSGTRTAVGAPDTKPVATVDTSQRLQHTIAFVDELTPASRAKPDGVQGCEIWVKIDGAPPVDPSELKYLATDTRTPYMAEFDGSQAGKTAYYMLRWVSTRGEAGPWSQTVSGTITN
jgi:hypothetical protein